MSEVSSPLGQLRESNKALSEYYAGVSEYLRTSQTPINFQDYAGRLSFEELLRRSTQDSDGAANYATATACEEVHNNMAHLRELAMVTKSKSECYYGATSEYYESSEFHKDRSVFLSSLLTGENRVGYIT